MAVGARKKRRIRLLAIGGVALAASVALAGIAFNDAIVFFVGPTELVARAEAGEAGAERRLRLGGLVEDGSVERLADGSVAFRVTDGETAVRVEYAGVLPDLFREGQGVVAEGVFTEARFEAATILAKHDENYMPAEVRKALEASGNWKPEDGVSIIER